LGVRKFASVKTKTVKRSGDRELKELGGRSNVTNGKDSEMGGNSFNLKRVWSPINVTG